MTQFLKLFQDRNGKGVTYIKVRSFKSAPVPFVEGLAIDSDSEVWFTPAYRVAKGPIDDKKGVVGTNFLWAEVDKARSIPQVAFKPTIVVDSGHGYHLYWQLETPLTAVNEIEALNKILHKATTTGKGESIHNANRLMRVPDTMNRKSEYDDAYVGQEPVPTKVVAFEPTLIYQSEDFHVLSQLSKHIQHVIRTGDTRKYESRSERDWAVVNHLLAGAATERLIKLLFASQPVGDKAREGNGTYLETTIASAIDSPMLANLSSDEEVVVTSTRRGRPERDEEPTQKGLFIHPTRKVYMFGMLKYDKEISTFVLKPKVVLRDRTPKTDMLQGIRTEDYIIADVETDHSPPEQVEMPKSAFDTIRRMNEFLTSVNWTWKGADKEVKELLPFLMDQARELKIPQLAATPVQGLHLINGRWTFVTDSGVLTADTYSEGYKGDIVWLPTGREHPVMYIRPEITQEQLSHIGRLAPAINDPEVMWPLLGWYAAAALKPWLEEQDLRYPILNVAGIRGSGKTTVIQRVLLPLFGHKSPKSYDANTTKFVKLSLLGSTNAVPIALSEFRHSTVEDFEHYIRLAYDTGHDPRGRADQTTVDYPLSAPFSVDGEDYLTRDAAIRQRVVVVEMLARSIAHNSPANKTYKEFHRLLPDVKGFGGYFIQRCLQMIESGDMLRMLEEVRKAHFEAFTMDLPDRTRNNQVVTLLGMWLFADTVGIERPPADLLLNTLDHVFNTRTGRDGLLVDEWAEDVATAITSNTYTPNFPFHYEEASNVLYVHAKGSHGWWLLQRRRKNMPTLDVRAIKSQLRQCEYYAGRTTIDDHWMLGIDLKVASDLGLDLPSRIDRGGPGPRSTRADRNNGQESASAVIEEREDD